MRFLTHVLFISLRLFLGVLFSLVAGVGAYFGVEHFLYENSINAVNSEVDPILFGLSGFCGWVGGSVAYRVVGNFLEGAVDISWKGNVA